MIAPVNFTARKINLDSIKIYNEHPNLAPRNIYLSMGRVIENRQVDRKLENIGEPAWKRTKNWFKNKIEDILGKIK